MRHSTLRLTCLLVGAALATLLLAACGTASYAPGSSASPQPGAPSPSVATQPADLVEVVGKGILMQDDPTARVELCQGMILTSDPPQCAGPGLAGEFSWDDVEVIEHSGVRFTDVSYYALGHYDRATDTLTLTRPLSTTPPEGISLGDPPADPDFPQLCEDPFRGGDPDVTEDFAAQERLQQRIETLDGYVSSWVSDGHDLFNVLVTGEAEAVHEQLRQIWPGGLCVAQHAGPTQAEMGQAQQALTEHPGELMLQGSYPDAATSVLYVEVLLADDATVARIHEILAPWLAPDQVQVTGSLHPIE